MSALAAVLDRAAAFLRALPEGTPEPSFTAIMERPTFTWRSFLPFPVQVQVSIRWSEQIQFAGNTTAESWDDLIPFDGEHIPPEIVDAIRKVVGDG